MRSSGELQRLQAITESLQSLPSLDLNEASTLAGVLPQLRALLGAEVSCAYAVQVDEGVCRPDFVLADGLNGNFREATFEYFQRAPIPWGFFDPSRPDPSQRNRAVLVTDVKDAAEKPPPHIARDLFPKFGLHTRDQVRVLLCEDASLLAWVGAFRTEPFTEHDRDLLNALVQPLRTRLALERRLRRSHLASAALTATLDHLGAPAFILTASGSVVEANAAGRQLLSSDPHAREQLRRVAETGDGSYTVTALAIPGLPPHHLAVRRLEPITGQARAAAAAGRWRLTRRQSEVLALLTEGMSNRAIAARLTCSESTVEIHVSAIFTKAEVESRAALVAKVWSQG